MTTLTAQHISVQVDEKMVVYDVSLTLTGGEISILMGPNGSGKSTFMNALMGHPRYRVTEGTCILDGVDIGILPPHEKARAGLFLSPQHTPKVGGVTLTTFLHKVHTACTGETIDILEYYLQLRDMAKRYGIRDTLLDRPLTDGLSGGERKLSEVLQLIALRPQFALLDEIDSGVDVDVLRMVCDVIVRLAHEGTGFLIVSHHPSILDHITPTHVHLMAEGRLVRSAGHELAEEIHRDGFCNAIACPMVKTCKTKHEYEEETRAE